MRPLSWAGWEEGLGFDLVFLELFSFSLAALFFFFLFLFFVPPPPPPLPFAPHLNPLPLFW